MCYIGGNEGEEGNKVERQIENRYGADNISLVGATLIRQSRSGVTKNYRLPDGRVVETYEYKSGRVDGFYRQSEDESLVVISKPRCLAISDW